MASTMRSAVPVHETRYSAMTTNERVRRAVQKAVNESTIRDLQTSGIEIETYAVYTIQGIPFKDTEVVIFDDFSVNLTHREPPEDVRFFIKEEHTDEYYCALVEDLYINASRHLKKYEEVKDEYPERFV